MAESPYAGGPWWVVAAAGIPSCASALWVVWQWWSTRDEKRADRELTREQVLMKELEGQRAALSREHVELLDRLRTELTRREVRCAELERDRDRGWDLARWWHQRAHQLRHAGVNAQTVAAGLCRQLELDLPVWPDMTLPHLEEPK